MIKLQQPDLQVNFAYALIEIREKCLQDALRKTVSELDIRTIDAELHKYANEEAISILASHGMRGELLFVVPSILQSRPCLIAYYRLLLGYSQKEFYDRDSDIKKMKSMEEKDTISPKQSEFLEAFCLCINDRADYLLKKLTTKLINPTFFDQLTLLTFGPQFRGGANVKRGTSSINDVFQVIFDIVQKHIVKSNKRCIELKNASKRRILIQFAADPDIVIREELAPEVYKNLIAIEVKGGQDYSNIHNRVGEAEKSHQKAKKNGYIECWTVVNVDCIDKQMAQRESPTTNKFYRISDLINKTGPEYKDFVMQILSVVGIQ